MRKVGLCVTVHWRNSSAWSCGSKTSILQCGYSSRWRVDVKAVLTESESENHGQAVKIALIHVAQTYLFDKKSTLEYRRALDVRKLRAVADGSVHQLTSHIQKL